MSLDELISQFKAFSYDDKKRKLLWLYTYMKENGEDVDNTINYLNWDNVEEIVMVKLYELLMWSVLSAKDSIEKEKMEAINKQEYFKQALSSLEEQQAIKDNKDIDTLLDIINNL